jgi:para-nitrobenzyl esterase
MSARQRIDRTRRSVIKTGLAGFVAAGASGLRIAEAQTPARSTGPLFFDVETVSGRVRGIANTGIKIFRGIPYGADTSGRNRFMPPRKPAAWTGIRHCLGYGPISPQTMSGYRSDYCR